MLQVLKNVILYSLLFFLLVIFCGVQILFLIFWCCPLLNIKVLYNIFCPFRMHNRRTILENPVENSNSILC